MTYQGQGVSGGQAQQQQQRWARAYIAAITGAANNGSGLIRLTSANNKLKTGDRVTVASVGGTVEANGVWFVTKINGSSFDLVGSAFTNAYTSGGTARRG